ncbi:S41 family peptidase [Longimicrobium sp.]|uniref:S41 family peptidase n=1 Tax=Longimicrobium sp. TaxID=2029185 RepID=UPI002C8A911F|nr:S41 family peptidase [Longimicrobium sp.]HSU12976.1 S41 family peptidase [Longimicrobium sp.]
MHIPRIPRPVRLAALAMSAAAPLAAQEPREVMPVTPALADSVARSAADLVAAKYVFVEKGDEAARLVRRGVRAGRYRSLATAAALTDSITADLRRATGDAHLQVVYSLRARTAPPGAGSGADDVARDREAAQWRNFGFHQVERLDGNVGYLELGRFDDPALAGGTLASAMEFLAGTDALVIDLRNNGGGSAAMVALVASYFFPESTLLSTLHHRDAADDAQLWTLPHVAGPRYLDRPVYLLVSSRTFSAAEAFAYDLKAHGLATIVGENTRGGANPGGWQMIGGHFGVFVPTARVENAATHGNWEGVGIRPDVAVPAAEAKKAAHRAALERLAAAHADSPRAPRWREALEMLRADDARTASAAARP